MKLGVVRELAASSNDLLVLLFDLSILLLSLSHWFGCICLWFPAFSRFLQKYCSQYKWGSVFRDFDWAVWIIQGKNSRLDKLIFDFVKCCVLFWSPQPCTLGAEQLSWLSEFCNMRQKFSQLAHHSKHLLRLETECGGRPFGKLLFFCLGSLKYCGDRWHGPETSQLTCETHILRVVSDIGGLNMLENFFQSLKGTLLRLVLSRFCSFSSGTDLVHSRFQMVVCWAHTYRTGNKGGKYLRHIWQRDLPEPTVGIQLAEECCSSELC